MKKDALTRYLARDKLRALIILTRFVGELDDIEAKINISSASPECT
jgi:hypothetical protein